MDHGERIDAAARELAALNEAVAAGDPAATVPTCPDWSVADLAAHVGEFLGFWTHVLCEGTGREKPPVPDVPTTSSAGAGADVLAAWLADRGEAALAELGRTDPATAVWTWFEPDRSAGFVARRVLHELAVHRFDAQSARGPAAPIDPLVAVDGIGEVLGALVTTRGRSGRPAGQTIHLHGTDDDLAVPAEWLVTLHPDRVEVEARHAKGDLALRGAVSDLELLLYGRPPLGEVQRFGDEAVLDLWYGEFAF